jgi:hypothetical protein
VAIEFDEVTARPLDRERVLVRWRLKPTSDDLVGLEFVVQRSGGLNGPYVSASIALVDVDQFTDVRARLKHLHRDNVYRVVAQRTVGLQVNAVAISNPVLLETDPEIIGIEVARQMRLRLQRITGRPVATFSIRDWGIRCPNCFNPSQGRVSRSDCERCYGSGFLGGYWAQVDSFVDFSPTREQVQITVVGEFQQNQRVVVAGNFPPFKPRDIIVEQELDRRWRVVDVQPIDWKGFTVQQQLTITAIQKVDVEYRIPVRPVVIPADRFRGHGRIGGKAL